MRCAQGSYASDLGTEEQYQRGGDIFFCEPKLGCQIMSNIINKTNDASRTPPAQPRKKDPAEKTVQTQTQGAGLGFEPNREVKSGL